ncbi:MAG: hypothetical protein GIW99_05825, partial [Candidatus Eremiobacteraeota bacterium]|nr:hypothetical protein [Candidatus Eremiobacteraeota bacterium]
MTRQEQPSRVIRFRLELASAITLVAAVALGACNGGGTSSPPGPIRSTRITEFAVPSKASHPAYIATGSDGALWFTETAANKIGRVATDGTITENATGLSSLSQPMGITGGPDTALWFA